MEALGLVVVIATTCWLVSAALRWLIEDVLPRPVQALSSWVDRRRPRRGRADAADPVLLELELSRIVERLQAEYLSSQPAKAERIRCWTLAYDRVLIELCESCSVAPPRPIPPLSAAERCTVEHVLVGSGRSW